MSSMTTHLIWPLDTSKALAKRQHLVPFLSMAESHPIPTYISMALLTLSLSTDANHATASPNMIGMFLFNIHKIFRTHFLGSTFHLTPSTPTVAFMSHFSTQPTLLLYMHVQYGLGLLYPLIKGQGYAPLFQKKTCSQKGSGRLS
jgi:hypothetical protein